MAVILGCTVSLPDNSMDRLLWNLPDPVIKPRSLTLQVDSLPSEPPGKPTKPTGGKSILNEHKNETKAEESNS